MPCARRAPQVLGYPEELYSFTFDHKYMTRGLVMDKVRGAGCRAVQQPQPRHATLCANHTPTQHDARARAPTPTRTRTLHGHTPTRPHTPPPRHQPPPPPSPQRYGNVLKVDRHKYVKVGYHGFRKLTSEERSSVYHSAAATKDGFDNPDYAMIDTLFSLAEAYLYMQVGGGQLGGRGCGGWGA